MLKEIIELVGALLLGAAAGAAVGIIIAVTWNEIESWFDSHRAEIDNKDKVARTIVDSFSNGNYGVVYGVFDKRADRFISSESVECKKIDSELAKKHDYGRIRIVDHSI